MISTRTQKFRVKNVGFWKNGNIISRHDSLKTLLEAKSATLKISNKKNGRMRKILYHKSIGSKGDLADLAFRGYHILINKGT